MQNLKKRKPLEFCNSSVCCVLGAFVCSDLENIKSLQDSDGVLTRTEGRMDPGGSGRWRDTAEEVKTEEEREK